MTEQTKKIFVKGQKAITEQTSHRMTKVDILTMTYIEYNITYIEELIDQKRTFWNLALVYEDLVTRQRSVFLSLVKNERMTMNRSLV